MFPCITPVSEITWKHTFFCERVHESTITCMFPCISPVSEITWKHTFFCECVHESTITCMFPWPPLKKGPLIEGYANEVVGTLGQEVMVAHPLSGSTSSLWYTAYDCCDKVSMVTCDHFPPQDVGEPCVQLRLRRRDPVTMETTPITFSVSGDKFRLLLRDLKQAHSMMENLG